MQTIDIGPFFFAPAQFQTNLDSMPFVGTLPSQETEPPYRCSTVLFVRIPFTRYGGFVGWWSNPSGDPDQALLDAIAGEGFDLDDEIDEEDKRTVRALVSQHAKDWDDEWTILGYLGLDE